MTDKTSAQLQHEAEIARANVSDTAESIRKRMTPGQLIDEFSGMFTGGDGHSLLSTLKSQVGANPLPVALVGVGLAWLMAGQGAGQHVGRQSWEAGIPEGDNGADVGLLGEVAEAIKGAPGNAASVVGDTIDGMAANVSNAASSVSGNAAKYGSATLGQASQVTAAAADMLRQEPLVLAVLGLAFGTAVGTLLPHTEFEDAQLGHASGKIRDKAGEFLQEGVDGAKDVAAQAYQTLKNEADKQGLTGDSASIVDKVSDVVGATAQKTEDAVRGKLKTPPKIAH